MFDENPSREIRDKRIAIAKDVLAQLAAQTLRPSHLHRYLMVDAVPQNYKSRDLRDVVQTPGQVCRVCALGACLVAKARLYDQLPAQDLIGEDSCTGYLNPDQSQCLAALRDIFSARQLAVIEAAYEGMPDLADDAYYEAAMEASYYRREPELGAETLSRIMNNILANDGVFRPDLELDQVQ